MFEILSPNNRSQEIQRKVEEYLAARVVAACVVDPDTRTVTVHRAGRTPETFSESDELVLPELHADFRSAVRQLFR